MKPIINSTQNGILKSNNVGRPRIFTDEERRLRGNAYKRKYYALNREKYLAYNEKWRRKIVKPKMCTICGASIPFGSKNWRLCGNQECKKKWQKEYRTKYFKENSERVKGWHKNGYQRVRDKITAERPLKRCRHCNMLLGDGTNYKLKICEKCKQSLKRDNYVRYNKKYRDNNRGKEALRKAAWYQRNKRTVYLRSQARKLLKKLNALESTDVYVKHNTNSAVGKTSG